MNPAVAHGLRRRGIDVTTARDAGLIGAPDEDQLAYARTEGRVLVTHDSDHLKLHHAGVPHAGIAYCHPRSRSIGQLVLSLAWISRTHSAEDLTGQVEFL